MTLTTSNLNDLIELTKELRNELEKAGNSLDEAYKTCEQLEKLTDDLEVDDD